MGQVLTYSRVGRSLASVTLSSRDKLINNFFDFSIILPVRMSFKRVTNANELVCPNTKDAQTLIALSVDMLQLNRFLYALSPTRSFECKFECTVRTHRGQLKEISRNDELQNMSSTLENRKTHLNATKWFGRLANSSRQPIQLLE